MVYDDKTLGYTIKGTIYDAIIPEFKTYKENNKINKIDIVIQTKNTISSVGHLNVKLKPGIVKSGNLSSSGSEIFNYVASLNVSNSKSSFGTAIGVGNSFYIKDYDYYINEDLIEENRTTNEYIYTGLTENQQYKIKVNVEFYIGKSTDETRNGIIEEVILNGEDQNVTVYQLNVNDRNSEGLRNIGASTLVKTKSGKTILIDTGSASRTSGVNGGDVLNNFVQEFPEVVENKIIDYLIITHDHGDHWGGLKVAENDHGFTFNNLIIGEPYLEEYNLNNKTGRIYDIIDRYKQTTKGVNSGNVINLDGCVLNIMYPYTENEINLSFLETMDTENGIRRTAFALKPIELAWDRVKLRELESLGGYYQYTHSKDNNLSIVGKLICGSSKMLMMGDAEYLVDEILIGKVREEIERDGGNFKMPSGLINLSKGDDFNSQLEENTGKIIEITEEFSEYGYDDGLVINVSNGWYGGDNHVVSTTLNLVKDIMDFEGLKLEEVEQKYKLSRLTKKDISAQILKVGHHGTENATSLSLLNSVQPDRVMSTRKPLSNSWKTGRIQNFLDVSTEYMVRKYFEEKKQILINKNNWVNYIFNPVNSRDENYSTNYASNSAIKIESGGDGIWEGFEEISEYLRRAFELGVNW